MNFFSLHNASNLINPAEDNVGDTAQGLAINARDKIEPVSMVMTGHAQLC